ncbi:hypothetical protein JXO52_10660 [bacterium]|nr:hypothetical protein [bacterium]
MQGVKWCAVLLIVVLTAVGCSRYVVVSYDQVEKTNSVEIALNSGARISGAVFKKEPHQLSLLTDDRRRALVTKDNIMSIKRLPPVYDSFGNGISELEIAEYKTNRNAVIYGIGGGALSLGTSFFLGSMLAADSSRDGGAILAGSMAGLGIPGTVLFVRAGMAKDRKDAIEKINDKRISAKLEETGGGDPAQSDKMMELQKEKERQEALRKERERLLKELEEKKK